MTRSIFEGNVLVNTGRAIRFQGYYWGGALWFPVSQLQVLEEGDLGHCVVAVRDWLVTKRGLSEFTQYSAEEIEQMDKQE